MTSGKSCVYKVAMSLLQHAGLALTDLVVGCKEAELLVAKHYRGYMEQLIAKEKEKQGHG